MAIELSNLDEICSVIASREKQRPDFRARAEQLRSAYVGSRGTMIVDVVASRQRRYETYVKPKIIQPFAERRSGTLQDLAANPPTFLPLRDGEAASMSKVAQVILDYGRGLGSSDEEQVCLSWATLPSIHDVSGAHHEVEKVLAVKGMGPALAEYLRMLCGANTLKVDVRVTKSLAAAGVPVHMFTDAGIYQVCRLIAHELSLTLVELDSLLWLSN